MVKLGGEDVQLLVATKYSTVASLTLLLWDMFLTFDLEVSMVWRARKTLGTTLFFLNRYVPVILFALDIYSQFAPITSRKVCRNYQLSSTIIDLFSIAVIECVLVLRTNALYQNKMISMFLLLLAVVSISDMLAFYLVVFYHQQFIPGSTIGISGCLSGCTGSICTTLFAGFWVPFFCLETVVFALTAWKSLQSLRENRTIGGKNVVRIIIRDGILYYIVIMGASIGNLLTWSLEPFAPYLVVGVMKCLQVTICSRLMLNLRGLLETERYTGSTHLASRPQDTLLDLDSIHQFDETEEIEYCARSLNSV